MASAATGAPFSAWCGTAAAEAIEIERDGDELGQLRRRFVAELKQAERGDQREQRTVGDRTREVDRLGFAAEGERKRLRRLGPRQVIRGVPGQRQRQREQEGERDPCRERRIDHRAQEADEQRPDPVRQQRAVGRQAADRRRKPRRLALRDVDDVAERRDVGALPRVAAEDARQHVCGAQEKERQARQRLGFALADEGGVGRVHAGWIAATANDAASIACLVAPALPAKKAAEAAFSGVAPPYFFAPRWANLLRNFSTRPPSESTLFCVPV